MKRAALAAIVLAALAAPAAAEQPPDYEPASQQWNGISTFIGVAEGLNFRVLPVDALEWGDLSDQEILVLIYPLQRIDPVRLGEFLHAGGNVVIADDFGEGKDAMQALGLLRDETTVPQAARYEGNKPYAPIATGRPDHPVGKGVTDVVTNHPATMTHVAGASVVAAIDSGAIVVAGERGAGRFVAISDPSIFINDMMHYPGNIVLAQNALRWLNRNGRADRVVIVRGDVPMYGEPRPFIYDASAGQLGQTIAALNLWLSERRAWLLTPAAMKVLGAVLATALLLLALIALPVRRGPKIDGAWLRFARPARRDEPHGLIGDAERGAGSHLVIACVLRDHVQALIAGATLRPDPLYAIPESQLVAEVTAARGAPAGAALARVYRRLRALPSRGQAAAPWGAAQLARRDFDALYRDVAELCRTLGSALPDDSAAA